jgi:hypothetical protein
VSTEVDQLKKREQIFSLYKFKPRARSVCQTRLPAKEKTHALSHTRLPHLPITVYPSKLHVHIVPAAVKLAVGINTWRVMTISYMAHRYGKESGCMCDSFHWQLRSPPEREDFTQSDDIQLDIQFKRRPQSRRVPRQQPRRRPRARHRGHPWQCSAELRKNCQRQHCRLQLGLKLLRSLHIWRVRTRGSTT